MTRRLLCLVLLALPACSSGSTNAADAAADSSDSRIGFSDGRDAAAPDVAGDVVLAPDGPLPDLSVDGLAAGDGGGDSTGDGAGDGSGGDATVDTTGAADSSVDSSAPACLWMDVTQCATGAKIVDFCPAGRKNVMRLRRCDDSIFSGATVPTYAATYNLCSCAWQQSCPSENCVVWKQVECCQ